MPGSVLVAWATRYGSTEEVSQTVAAILREQGLSVEAQPMLNVENLDGFSAVVLGCALYMSHIHPDARHFLSAHRDELIRLPVALFALGPIHNDAKEWPAARNQLHKELSKFAWFHPVAQEIFGGRWDPAKLGFPFRWLPVVRAIPANDARDWEAIRAWAGKLPTMLQPALASA